MTRSVPIRPILGVLATLALGGPAQAEAPYDSYMGRVSDCVVSAASLEDARACIGIGTQACMEGAPDGQTTVGMMQCAQAEAAAWDVLLNAEYQRARDVARQGDTAETQPEFQRAAETLLEAQRAWIAYRDANCAMEYAQWGSGSMRMTAGSSCLLDMTAERTLDLRAYAGGFGNR
ncbi:DUF1311 domain-containing protein [Rhodobacter sp. NTK016B]|uniref:lysozyme inhibitor LprI family protein n=1 Tax=Rhodobacter sp. NTK016B TaxID=2759676 RepID=UPI001A8D0E13|nr:lysozyme inhibitor LprI family protein [Rhodobacter sp. NTK016B]MBN8293878.1 DUF1311 domain-containing protein [Rhodobacter sp. NTK016B]